MSSDRIDRKRRSDYSDDSSDELPPVKARRLETPKTIQKLKLITEAFKNFLGWITPEFVRKMTVRVSHQPGSSSLRMDSANQYTDVDDDEDIVEVINVQNGSTGARPRVPPLHRSTRSSNADICPLASTPLSFHSSTDDFYQNKISRTIEHRKLNGCATGVVAGKEDKIRLRSASEKCVAPITNPRSEIEILLEHDDSKEIEIINEVYPAKPSSGPTRKTRFLSERACKKDRIYVDDFMKCARSYTANEVVRLQEKAQYRLLLDRVVKRTLYRPAFPRKDSPTSAIQVDLTEDDDTPESSYHFKKEKVEIVNDFLSKYYKPCELVPRVAKTESQLNQTLSMIQRADTVIDDEVQIIENTDLPKLRPRKVSMEVNDIFSDKWIEELKTTISLETEKILQSVAEQEEKVKRYKKRRDAKIADEKRRREELRLAGMLSDDDVEMEEEVLPEITPEMETIICRAFALGDPTEVLSTLDRIKVTRNDIATLSHLNWLNDEVINFYFELILKRSKLDNYPSIHIFNSFFYTSIKSRGPRAVLRWTKKMDIFASDIILVPLHLEMHWALLIVDNRSKEIKYYDSMGSGEDKSLTIMQNYLAHEIQDKKKTGVDASTYSLVVPKDIPKQMNGSDCGMFTLKYAEYISRDAPITFTQENMPYFRRRMVYELISQKIL